ncbi:hypothetical protein [Albibacterium sp.]|uniref:hypothetical protein n=1 Tax=Albibacterium sp. TaxID=2952885 RepID=UPI002B880BD6|nr:hypothetical protein [Albibacterium sp.]HUH17628.1 hypothetical protein [Albibacterium sp.]
MSKQYDIFYIQQYLEGRLSAKDMHQLERDALEDSMLQDAIEGFRQSKSINHKQLSLLQHRLESRIEAQHTEKNRFYFTAQRLTVASVAGVMLIVIGILFWMTNNPQTFNSDIKNSQARMEVHMQDKANATLESGFLLPKDGWENFNDYLSINGINISEGEEVRLYFEVKDNHPQNIRIISSGNRQISQELIRLLQEGPLWEGESGELKIKF